MLRDQDQGSGQAELQGHSTELELYLCSGWGALGSRQAGAWIDRSRLWWPLGRAGVASG